MIFQVNFLITETVKNLKPKASVKKTFLTILKEIVLKEIQVLDQENSPENGPQLIRIFTEKDNWT